MKATRFPFILILTFLSANVACLPLRSLGRAISPPDHSKLDADLVYVPGSSNPRHRLDLVRPAGPTAKGLVVFVHGGYWTNQDRRYLSALTGLYRNIGYGLARHGYATGVISYRIYPGGRITEQLADVSAALAWGRRLLRYQANVRGSIKQTIAPRIFLMGHSAGAHLAMLAALADIQNQSAAPDDAPLAGVVAMAPILDLVDMQASQPPEFNAEVTTPVFGTANEPPTPARLAAYSPGLLWSRAAPPLLLITGTKDYPFIRRQAGAFAAGEAPFQRSGGARVRQTAIELPGLDHADLVIEFEDAPPLLPAIARFLNQPDQTGQ